MTETSTTRSSPEDVQRPLRCASCGGLNPHDARWCGQCLARFDRPEPAAQAPTTDAPSAPPAPPGRAPEAPPTPPIAAHEGHTVSRPEGGGDVSFQVTDEGISWTCSICGTVNELDRSACEVCSAPFARTVLPDEGKPQRDPNMAALVSLFLPGAGHAYVGLWGQAIARGVVSLWVWMVVLVAALQKGAASSNLVMVVFGVVAFALWGVGAHDAYREARNEGPLVILKGKIFFYMVLGLLLLLVALLMSAMVKAQGS